MQQHFGTETCHIFPLFTGPDLHLTKVREHIIKHAHIITTRRAEEKNVLVNFDLIKSKQLTGVSDVTLQGVKIDIKGGRESESNAEHLERSSRRFRRLHLLLLHYLKVRRT